jgi:hypothetical protein
MLREVLRVLTAAWRGLSPLKLPLAIPCFVSSNIPFSTSTCFPQSLEPVRTSYFCNLPCYVSVMLLIFSKNPSLPPRLVCDCDSYRHLNTTLAASFGVTSVNIRYCRACLVLELSCLCLIQTLFPYLIEPYFVLGLKKYT